jgi:hypothetical protein
MVDGQSQSGQLHTRHYNDSLGATTETLVHIAAPNHAYSFDCAVVFVCAREDTWEAGELCFVPLGGDFKGRTTTVLRSQATVLPTAGAARVEKRAARL